MGWRRRRRKSEGPPKKPRPSTAIFDLPLHRGSNASVFINYAAQLYLEEQQGSDLPFDRQHEPIPIEGAELREALADMPDVNVGDERGMTILHALCLVGSPESVEDCVRVGADVAQSDDLGFTPLHYCAISGRADIAERLLALHRPLINKQSRVGARKPIHIAAICGKLGVVKELLKVEPDMLTWKDGYERTPLWLATYYRHSGLARHILERTQFTYTEQSEIELSFLLRLATRIGPVATNLMERKVIKCSQRQVNYFWMDDVDVRCQDYHDAGLILCPGQNDHDSGIATLLSHKVFQATLNDKWNRFGRIFFQVYAFMKWVYIALWTVIYTLDSAIYLANDYIYELKVLLILNLGVIIFILAYDFCRLFFRMRAVRRFERHEGEIIRNEKLAAHPKMWNATKRLKKPKQGLGAYLKVRTKEITSANEFFEHAVDILTFIFLIYVMSETFSGTSRLKTTDSSSDSGDSSKTKRSADDGYGDKSNMSLENQTRDYLSSIILIMQYIVGLTTLRVFYRVGYIVEVLRKVCNLALRMGILFIVIYVPVVTIFWDTVYSWNVGNTTNLNETLNRIEFVFFETFRKTHFVYDYDLGLTTINDKGDKFDVSLSFWWYILHCYWSVMGSIIMLNMFISMMGETTNESKGRAVAITDYNTLIFVAEIEAMLPKLTSRRESDTDGFHRIAEWPFTKEEAELDRARQELERLERSISEVE